MTTQRASVGLLASLLGAAPGLVKTTPGTSVDLLASLPDVAGASS